jgi:hypothetical protein
MHRGLVIAGGLQHSSQVRLGSPPSRRVAQRIRIVGGRS